MKPVAARSPFGELPLLNPHHARRLSDLATELVDRAMDEYEQFVRVHKRQLARAEWKPVKKLENLTLFRQRRSRPVDSDAGHRTQSAPSSSASTPFEVEPEQHMNWKLPKVVTIGMLPGALDDVMLGLTAPDAAAMMRRSAYNKEGVVDADVLYPIAQPTDAEPFAFLGVKWVVLELHAMSRRRDVVYLESSGVRKLPDGRRVGFLLTHSIDEQLEGCASLEKSHNVLRSRVSSCYLFTAADDKTQRVDVYMKGFVQPSGNMVDAFAISTTATAVLHFVARSVEYAQHLKLAHKVGTAAERECTAEQQLVPVDQGAQSRARSSTAAWIQRHLHGDKNRAKCSVCRSSGGALSAFKRLGSAGGGGSSSPRQSSPTGMDACELCARRVCVKCRMARKVLAVAPAATPSVARSKQLRQSTVVVCTACMVRSNQQDARDVARADLRAMTAIGSGRRSSHGAPRPLAASCGASGAKSEPKPAREYSPMSAWHQQYVSLRSSTPGAIPGFPAGQDTAEVEPATPSATEESTWAMGARGSAIADVMTALEPVSASILVVKAPSGAMKQVETVAMPDRRARGGSQPVSESGSTDRESTDRGSSVDEYAEGEPTGAMVLFSDRRGESSASSRSSNDAAKDGGQCRAPSELWMRIAELRRNAEDVYQLTLRATASMSSSASVCAISPMDDLD